MLFPAARARSMIAKAPVSFSPRPKSSGADPIPPKLPQPRPMLESSRPVPPRRLYSTGGRGLVDSSAIRVTIATVGGYGGHEQELGGRPANGDKALPAGAAR